MILPDYWLKRPDFTLDTEARSEIERIYAGIQAAGSTTRIDFALPVPKWQFLCYLTDQHGVVVHGTGDPNIQEFEPRASNDLNPFGAETAIYAAGDGLWAMFYAIVDRAGFSMATSNACVRLVDPAGQASDPLYVFAISHAALRQQPWRKGTVYLLPGDTFIRMPSLAFGPYEVRIPQLKSLVPVRPFAQIEIAPEDFPFLKDIRGLDDARLAEYGEAMQTGAPWPE